MDTEEWMSEAHPLDMLEESLPTASAVRMRRFAAEVCRSIGQVNACEELLRVAEGSSEGDLLDRIHANVGPWMPTGSSFNPRRQTHREQILQIVAAARAENPRDAAWRAGVGAFALLQRDLIPLVQCIFGNPFHPAAFDPDWRTSTVVSLVQQMYNSRDCALMPILGDALQDAGCDSGDILAHCRGDGPHVRGCWVVDLVLGKE